MLCAVPMVTVTISNIAGTTMSHYHFLTIILTVLELLTDVLLNYHRKFFRIKESF